MFMQIFQIAISGPAPSFQPCSCRAGNAAYGFMENHAEMQPQTSVSGMRETAESHLAPRANNTAGTVFSNNLISSHRDQLSM